MINPSTKRNFWIFLILAILLVVGFSTLIYFIAKSKLEIQVLKTKIYSEDRQIKDIDNLKRLLIDTADSRLALDKLFIGQNNTVDFLETLESLGKLSGAKTEVVSVDEDKPIGKDKKDKVISTKIKVRFKGEGSWSEVYKLVGLVSNLSYSMQIKALDLIKNEESDKSWEVVFEIIVDKI